MIRTPSKSFIEIGLATLLALAAMAKADAYAQSPAPDRAAPPAGAPSADAGFQFVRWDRRPIKLHLKTGAERIVWFPGKVQPGVPPALAQQVRVQANGDTVYFKPRQSFPETRFPVRDLASGRIYLLDVTASDAGSAEPVRVLATDETTVAAVADSAAQNASVTPAPERSRPDYSFVDLTRFAAKQFYAPERLAESLPGVYRTSLNAKPTTALVRGADTLATPLASWRSPNGLVVTAVRIKNLRTEPVAWDPRRLRGDWLTAASQHEGLGANGSPSDTTVIYLISESSFTEAAAPWLSR